MRFTSEEWTEARKALGALPAIGTVLGTLQGEEISPGDTISPRSGYIVRCVKPDVIEEVPRWGIHAGADVSGVVCFLKGYPKAWFSAVRITGHAKNGKYVFGEVVYD